MTVPALATAPPPQPTRPRVLVVGTAFLTGAVVMVFAGLIGMYLLYRGEALSNSDTWLPNGATIPLTQPNVMLFGLLMSSITIQWAITSARNDDRPNTYLALGLTFVFGLAYINMTAYLYSLMGLDIDAHIQAVLLYAVTGGHLLMTLVAMFFVGFMAFRALGGQYLSRHNDGLVAAAVFWHAMVGVYCVIWIAIYVMK